MEDDLQGLPLLDTKPPSLNSPSIILLPTFSALVTLNILVFLKDTRNVLPYGLYTILSLCPELCSGMSHSLISFFQFLLKHHPLMKANSYHLIEH